MTRSAFFLLVLLFWASCGRNQKTESASDKHPDIDVPHFNADSSYLFVSRQVGFGPRIPNSAAAKQTGEFLISKLKGYGGQVTVQSFEATAFDGQHLKLRNIIAAFYPDRKKRVLLAAHWDTRPFADQDSEFPNATLDGANDGASGVAVLLEVARLLSENPPPNVGVDIILFDGEDYGEREDVDVGQPPAPYERWWCLGSQYWSRHKHVANYSAYYGILLDMVGGRNAQFRLEAFSMQYAPKVVRKVWSTAGKLGYDRFFVNQEQGAAIDDHKYMNEVAKIPSIDIINYDPTTRGFGDFWHTTKDNMDVISKNTLEAVGQTITAVVFYE